MCASFILKNGKNLTKLGSRKLHTCSEVTKIGSIIGHRIDYNGVGALSGSKVT